MKNPIEENSEIKFQQLKGDPILYFLNSKLELSPFKIAVVFIFIAAVMIPWAMLTGVWQIEFKPLSESYHTWIGDILLGVTNMFIVIFYINFSKSLEEVRQKGILTDKNNELIHLTNSTISKIYNLKKHIVVLLISLTICAYVQFQWCDDGLRGWTEINEKGTISALGYYHLIYFAIELFIIINFVWAVTSTINLFGQIEKMVIDEKIKYDFVRLCEHFSGGLKPLNDIAMDILRILFTLGLYTALLVFTIMEDIAKNSQLVEVTGNVKMFSWHITELLLLPVYALVAPTIFFMILIPIHRIMKNKKNSLYQKLQMKDNELDILEIESIDKVFTDLNSFEKVKLNEELFTLIQKLPSWPFNSKSITKLISIIIIPLIPIIIEIILKCI